MNLLSEATRNNLQEGVKKYARILVRARERSVSESDTRDMVRAMLGDMLGYDPFFDVTAESVVRGPHASFLVLPDTKQAILTLVKPLAVVPHAVHLLRLSGVNTPSYADWALLTNGDVWAVYRLGVGDNRHPELLFRVSLSEGGALEGRLALFGLLCKEAVEKGALREYWEQTRVLNPGRLAQLLLSEETLQMLRRVLQRQANYQVDLTTLREALEQSVLRPDALHFHVVSENELREYPHCFAYVRSPKDPASWRLPYRNPDGTPNAESLAQTLTELQGEHGIAGVPADDVPLVKRRLREAFLELGVPLEELPRALRYV